MEQSELARAGFHWRERNGVKALVCDALERDGFTNAFSTRVGGVSPFPSSDLNLAGFNDDDAENIHENRRRFLKLFDNNWRLTGCFQVHSANVRVVRDLEDAKNDTEICDALITRAEDVLLAVKVADCVPVLLADSRTGAVAAIHAGWRGTLASIVPKTIDRMRDEFGTRASDIRAAVGPAALGCCYEVGREVIEAFQKNFDYGVLLFALTRKGHARIDLHRANFKQLFDAGVDPDRVHLAPLCTMERTDLFFSYRREKALHGKTGRLMAVVGKSADG